MDEDKKELETSTEVCDNNKIENQEIVEVDEWNKEALSLLGAL